uniref:Uncharacterized protein n=1 Tax=Globodera rostochiensis TaxID=31243 RepID=A0A914HFL4_GLORO
MAPAVPEWTRQWHKFLVERIGIDSLQLGLLLLMLLSLLTLLLSIMSVSLRFCCCPKRSAGRCRRRKPTEAMPSRTPTNGFTGTNEERRCLLQPNGICAVAVSSRAPHQAQQQQLEKKAEPNFEVDHRAQQQAVTEPTVGAAPPQPPAQFEKSAIVADPVKASLCQIPLALTPRGNLPPSRPAHFSVESPPPPRRFASSGGRTQVLPLTSQNRRRVPPLVMLMAEQQQQQLHHRQQMMARGRMPTTPDSRATTTTTTTGGMKSCATIPEDPEETNHRPLADELLSIDRTFVSADDEQQQEEEEVHRFVHRLPLHQPPPTFEVQPPTYSPPEPPSKMMPKNFWCESNNLSRSSYGAQTSLNTTTGSSADESITTSSIVVVVVNRRNVVEEEEVRISELESETGAPPAPPPPSTMSSNGIGHAAIVQHHRVPRSISQQLELMNMTTQS